MKESKKMANDKLAKRILSIQFENLIFKILFLIISLVYLYNTFISKSGYYEKLRVKELLVEDTNGVDRIIISTGKSNNGSRLINDASSEIVFLDKNGVTRIVIGFTKDNIPSIQYFDENSKKIKK